MTNTKMTAEQLYCTLFRQ